MATAWWTRVTHRSKRACWDCGIARARTARGLRSRRPSLSGTSPSSARCDTSASTKSHTSSTRFPGRGGYAAFTPGRQPGAAGYSPAERARAPTGNAYPSLLELRGGVLMRMPRPFWLPIVVFLTLAGCNDATAPLDQPFALAEVAGPLTLYDGLHVLQQAPTAPALESYHVSLCARPDPAS